MVASAFALAFDIVLRRDFKSAPSFAVPSMVYELMDAVEEPTKPSPANSVRLAKPPMEDWDGIVKLALALFATVETAAAVNKAKAALRSTLSSALAVTTVCTFDLLVVCVCNSVIMNEYVLDGGQYFLKNNEGDVGQEKTKGRKISLASLSFKKSHLSPFFPYLRREGSRLIGGKK